MNCLYKFIQSISQRLTAWTLVNFAAVSMATAQTVVNSLAEITDAAGNYILSSTFSPTGTAQNGNIGTSSNPFTGTIEGDLTPIIGTWDKPLFDYVDGAVIKNVILEEVSISTSGQVGAIARVARGASRIYNCGILGGSVGSTGGSTANSSADCCGGLVGLLDGESRVINCYSYANITGGNRVGGIVGYNNVATTSSNLKTMVMNCMFYGNITGGENKAPIYNGIIISNAGNNGVGNYNYFRLEAPYVQPEGVTYNCALGAEDRFLQRFEFFRHLLNSHRELAA